MSHSMLKSNGQKHRKYYRTFTEQAERRPSKRTIPQEVKEENLSLKKFINQLQDQLVLQRGKVEAEKRKNGEYSRQINREYSKQFYYSSKAPNSYLISGIKHQYEQIKLLYQQKCKDYEKIQSQSTHTALRQLEIYCDTLENQNKSLLETIMHSSRRDSFYLEEQSKFASKIDHQDCIKKLKKVESELKQSQLKIIFLEKVLIQKDNNEAFAKKKAKKLLRQKQALVQHELILQKQLQREKNQSKVYFQEQRKREQLKAIYEREQFDRIIEDKNIKIAKLQKEIKFMSTLLSYWKPTQRDESYDKQAQAIKQASEQENSQNVFETKKQQKFVQLDRISSPSEQVAMKRTISNDSSFLQKKNPQSAFKKHNLQAVKCRKVIESEITHITDLLKYKLLGCSLPIDAAKKLFDHPISQYISMKDVKVILRQNPFFLNEASAHLYARYIVEDCPNEYVYCDDENEVGREVAKSILKASIPSYKVGEGKEEWVNIMKSYATNMKMALKSIAPKGIVLLKDFVDLLIGLGIEASEEAIDWCIAQMIKSSDSLSALKYDILFC